METGSVYVCVCVRERVRKLGTGSCDLRLAKGGEVGWVRTPEKHGGWASVLGTMGLSVPTAPTTHYHLSSPCVWHSGSGFWMEPCGPRPGSFCLSLPPPLPRLHPGSWSRALSVSQSSGVHFIFSAFLILVLCLVTSMCLSACLSVYVCPGLSFGLPVPAYTCVCPSLSVNAHLSAKARKVGSALSTWLGMRVS